jgi:hypothetical protein
VLFLGAGVHAPPPEELSHLYPARQRPPLTSEITRRLAEKYNFPGGAPYEFRQVAQYVEDIDDHRSLVKELTYLLEGKTPSPMLEALARLPFPIILSTNFDRLLEEALVKVGKRPSVVTYHPGRRERSDSSLEGSPQEPVVLKLHGDLQQPETPVLTEDDFLDFVVRMTDPDSSDSIVPSLVRSWLYRRLILLIGFRLGSFDTRFLLRSLFWRVPSLPRLYVLDWHSDPMAVRNLERSYKARIVTADLWSFVPELCRAVTGEDILGIT